MPDARDPPGTPCEYPLVFPLLDHSDAVRLSPEFAAMFCRGAKWLSGEVGTVARDAWDAQAVDERDAAVLADWRCVCEKFLGESLDQWLGKEFFRYHTQRYKRRPVIWQLCSRRPANRRVPAFTCLVHCQQVDAQLLPRLRQRLCDSAAECLPCESCERSVRPHRIAVTRRHVGSCGDDAMSCRGSNAFCRRWVSEGSPAIPCGSMRSPMRCIVWRRAG